MQQKKSQLNTADSGLKGETVDLEGKVHVDKSFSVEAKNSITVGVTALIEKGDHSVVDLKAHHIVKQGKLEADKLLLEASLSSKDINQFTNGKNTQVSDLQIVTDRHVELTKTFTSANHVTLVAAGIKNNAVQHLDSCALVSTVGNVENNQKIQTTGATEIHSAGKAIIHGSVKGRDVDIYGRKGVVVQKHIPSANTIERSETLKIQAKNNLSLKSGAGILVQGDVAGKHTQLIAKGDVNVEENYTTLSLDKDANAPQQLNIKTQTHISGQKVLIKANNLINDGQRIAGTEVNLELENDLTNKNQGTISGSALLHLKAKNVDNQCQVNEVQGDHGPKEVYNASYIIGGDGTAKGAEGVGLYMHTSGKVVNDASTIASAGSNLIRADEGFQSTARSSTYVAEKEKHHSFLGLKKEETEIIETSVGRSTVSSLHGQNVITSEKGGLEAVATDFSAAKGTYVKTALDAEFYDLVVARDAEHKKQNLFFHVHEKSHDEFSVPTVVADQEEINIISKNDVTMRGTEISTPGHYYVEAKKYETSVSKLNHTYERSTFGMSATLCNQQLLKLDNDGDVSKPLWNGDPTISQLQQLANSHGITEVALNTWNTGIDTANTANALVNGLRTNTVFSELAKRELPGVFPPQLDLNITRTKTHVESESLGAGSIQVGSADFEVQDTVKLKGAPVHVSGDFAVNCEKFIAQGDQVHATVDQKTQNVNFTTSATGKHQVGVSASHIYSTSEQQMNEQIDVEGTLNIHTKNMTLDGAVVDTGSIAGEVGKLNTITHTDKTDCKMESIAGNTSGVFSGSLKQSKSEMVNQASELHVGNSIQANEFKVGEFNSVGGKVVSDGENNLQTLSTHAQAVPEYQHSSGFAMSGNINDFRHHNHSLPSDKQSAPITTTNFNYNSSNYKAENQTVIYGTQGTHMHCDNMQGTIITDSTDGRKVIQDITHDYNFNLPHIVPETKEQSAKNIQWAKTQLDEMKHYFASPQASSDDNNNDVQRNGSAHPAGLSNAVPCESAGSSTHPASDQLEPWQQNALANVDLGLGNERENKLGNPSSGNNNWEQEAATYFEKSQPISNGNNDSRGKTNPASLQLESWQQNVLANVNLDLGFAGANDSNHTKPLVDNHDKLAYVYSAPKSYNEQASTYFHEQMNCYNARSHDYEEDTSGRKGDYLEDLVFNEQDLPKHIEPFIDHQKNFSKPKDWTSSLTRWEQKIVADFNKSIFAENTSPAENTRSFQSIKNIISNSAASLTAEVLTIRDPIVSHTTGTKKNVESILHGVQLKSHRKNLYGGDAFYVTKDGFFEVSGSHTVSFRLSRKTKIIDTDMITIKPQTPAALKASFTRSKKPYIPFKLQAKIALSENFDAIRYDSWDNEGGYNLAIIQNPQNLTPTGVYPGLVERENAFFVPIIRGMQTAGMIGSAYAIGQAGYTIIHSDHPVVETAHQTALFSAAVRGGMIGRTYSLIPCGALGMAFPPIAPYSVPICIGAGSMIGGAIATIATELTWQAGSHIISTASAMTPLACEENTSDKRGSYLDDLIFNEQDLPKPINPLTDVQQSFSKPKDWESSLPCWERETVADFNKMIFAENISPAETSSSSHNLKNIIGNSAASLTADALTIRDPIVSHTTESKENVGSILNGIQLKSHPNNSYGGDAFYVAENGYSIREVFGGTHTVAFRLSRKTKIIDESMIDINTFLLTSYAPALDAMYARSLNFDAIKYEGNYEKAHRNSYNLAIVQNPQNLTPTGVYPALDTKTSAISVATIRGIQVVGMIGSAYAIGQAGYTIIHSDHPVVETAHQTALFAAAVRGGMIGRTYSIIPCGALGMAFPPIAPYSVPICIGAGSMIGGAIATIATELAWQAGNKAITTASTMIQPRVTTEQQIQLKKNSSTASLLSDMGLFSSRNVANQPNMESSISESLKANLGR